MISEAVEARPAKPGWDPITPSEEERREHEASGHGVPQLVCGVPGGHALLETPPPS